MLKVKIIAHTPEPDKVVAQAGKLCYSAVGVDEITQKLTEEEIARYVNMLASIGHESPLEHVSFTFAIEGISRVCTHQIVRHRIASYSQQSQRYVDLKDTFQYIIPEAIYNNDKARELYIESMDSDFCKYKEITDALCNDYIKDGLNEKAALKKALEDARFALPNACETKIIVTMNARSLYNFFSER